MAFRIFIPTFFVLSSVAAIASTVEVKDLCSELFVHAHGAPISSTEWKEEMRYVRTVDYWLESDPVYLRNAKQAEQKFADDYRSWLSDPNTLTFEKWKQSERSRHLIITGVAARTPYRANHGHYISDSLTVKPGVFRHEGSRSSGVSLYTDPAAQFHLIMWLTTQDLPMVLRKNATSIQVRGRKQEGRIPSFHRDFAHTYLYPHEDDLEALLFLAFERLQEVVAQVSSGAFQQERVLNEISDYYHTSITSLFFEKVNNSMLMPEVNVMLESIGLHPVNHGLLDIIALQMNYLDFRVYFKQYLRFYGAFRAQD